MISIRMHNKLDYAGALMLVMSPWFFEFNWIHTARNVFVVSGIFLAMYSLLTQYHYSLFKIISINTHLALDAMLGIVLIFAPYLWDYSPLLTAPQSMIHWIFGVGVVALVLFTNQPSEVISKLQSKYKKAA